MADTKIVVTAKQRGTAFCPVRAELSLPIEEVEGKALVDEQGGLAVPFQVERSGEGCRLHWILDSAAAGQARSYLLTNSRAPAEGSLVDLSEREGCKIEVRIGGELFTRYFYGEEVPRPVLYPLIGPFGHGVTRAYPMEQVEGDHTDHVHHRSLWVGWGDVNGSDNWSEEKGSGRVVHRGFEGRGGGPVFGWIASRNDWLDADGTKLMEDRLTCRFYNLPAGMRLLEFEVTFSATEGDVRFGDTKEGGICCVRVAYPMEVDLGGRIENAFGGVNEEETWGKRAQWCDYSGVVEGHRVGIAVFDHPSNLRHPTYWHVRNYGLMTANPFALSHFLAGQKVDGSYTLPAGESLAFRYAVYVHAGDATEGGVKGRYLDWVYPPEPGASK